MKQKPLRVSDSVSVLILFALTVVPVFGVSFREIGPRGNLSGTIAVSRSYPRLIVHLDEGEVNVSEDSGESWNAIPAPPQVYSCDLIASPWTRRELFICNSSAVYYCDEFSGVWTDRSPPDYLPDSEERQFLRADPSVPGRLILFYCDGLGFLKLFETLDRGVSWHALPVPPGIFQPVGFTIPEPSGQSLIIQVQTEESTQETVYFAVTDDMGDHWRLFPTPSGNPCYEYFYSAGWIWVNDYEFFKKPWVGGEWQYVQTPVPVYYSALFPGTTETIAIKDNHRLYLSTDNGISWIEHYRFYEPTGFMLKTSEQWVVRSADALLVSTDDGVNFTPRYSGSRSARISRLSFDPLSPGRIYASGSNLWVTSDDGNSWTRTDPYHVREYEGVIPDPNEAGRLYACNHDLGMITSTDRGESWHLYNENCSETNIGYATFAPDSGELLLLNSNRGYARAPTDTSWTRFDSSWQGSADLLTINPVQHQIWHFFAAGSGCGDAYHVFRSSDGGLQWTQILYSYDLLQPFSLMPHSPNLVIAFGQDSEYRYRLMTLDLESLDLQYREYGWVTALVFVEAVPDQFIYGISNPSTPGLWRSSPYRLWGTPIVSGLDESFENLVADPYNPDRILIIGETTGGLYELILTDHVPPGKPTVQSVVPRHSFVEFSLSIPDDAYGIKLYSGVTSGEYDACRIAGREELEAGPITLSADPDTLLWYRISCYDADGNEGEWTEEASVRVRSRPENAPKILLAGYLDTRIARSGNYSGKIAVWVDDPQGVSDVTEILVHEPNGNTKYTLHDDGTGVDPYPGDGFFITRLDSISVPYGYYRFQAVDSHGDRSDYAPLLSTKGDSR